MKKDMKIVDKKRLCLIPILAAKPKVQWTYVTGTIFEIRSRNYALVALTPTSSALIDVDTGIPVNDQYVKKRELGLDGANECLQNGIIKLLMVDQNVIESYLNAQYEYSLKIAGTRPPIYKFDSRTEVDVFRQTALKVGLVEDKGDN